MPISFSCHCGKKLRAQDERAGKRVKCPACGSAVVVPLEAALKSEKAVPLKREGEQDPELERGESRIAAEMPGLAESTHQAESRYLVEARQLLRRRMAWLVAAWVLLVGLLGWAGANCFTYPNEPKKSSVASSSVQYTRSAQVQLSRFGPSQLLVDGVLSYSTSGFREFLPAWIATAVAGLLLMVCFARYVQIRSLVAPGYRSRSWWCGGIFVVGGVCALIVVFSLLRVRERNQRIADFAELYHLWLGLEEHKQSAGNYPASIDSVKSLDGSALTNLGSIRYYPGWHKHDLARKARYVIVATKSPGDGRAFSVLLPGGALEVLPPAEMDESEGLVLQPFWDRKDKENPRYEKQPLPPIDDKPLPPPTADIVGYVPLSADVRVLTHSLHISAGGERIAFRTQTVSGNRQYAECFDVKTKQSHRMRIPVQCYDKWSPELRQFAICDVRSSSSVEVWTLPEFKRAFTLESPGISHMSWSPDEKRLLTVSYPNKDSQRQACLELWDASDGQALRKAEHPFGEVLKWTPDGRSVLLRDESSKSLVIWDTVDWRRRSDLGDEPLKANYLHDNPALSTDGQWMAVDLTVYETSTGKRKHSWNLDRVVLGPRFSTDRQKLYFGRRFDHRFGCRFTILEGDVNGGGESERVSFEIRDGDVTRGRWIAESERILLRSHGKLFVYHSRTGVRMASVTIGLGESIYGVSRDGSHVAFVDQFGKIAIWKLPQ